jgi:carboxylate-amine ligase
LNADLLDPQTGQVIAAHTLIDKFLSFLRPALETQGDWEEVSALVASVLRDGIGATRQRRAFHCSHQWSDLVNFIVAETAKGTKFA